MTTTQLTDAIGDPIDPVAGSFSKAGTWPDDYNPAVERLIAEPQRAACAGRGRAGISAPARFALPAQQELLNPKR